MTERKNLDKLKNAVVIAPRELHDSFLCIKNEHPDYDFQVMDIESFISMFTYQYDDRAVQDLLQREIPYRRVLDMLKLMSSKNCLSLLNDEEKQIRHQLLTDYYLYPFAYPERTFQNKTVVISGYHHDKFITGYLKDINVVDICRFDDESSTNPVRTIYSFADIYEEVHYLFNAIAEDIESGTDINDIYVLGADENYDMLFDEFGRHYGFEIEGPNPCDLSHSKTFCRYFVMKADGVGADIFDKLVEEGYPIEDVEAIEKIVLRYTGVMGSPDYDLKTIIDICKTKTSHKVRKANIVKRLTSFVAPAGSHVYIVNFSMGSFPKVSEEGSYLTDEKNSVLGFLTSEDKNYESKKELESLLNSDNVKFISFKKLAFGSEFFESSFVGNLELKAIESPISKHEYSDDKGAWFLSMMKDRYRNFLIVDKRLREWEKAVEVPDYHTYDHSFKNFVIDPKYINRDYSASSVKKYNSCPFSFFVGKLMGINSFRSNFNSRAGDVYHLFLSDYYNDRFFDENLSWEKAVANIEGDEPFTNKEMLFLDVIHEYAIQALEFHKVHEAEIKNPSISTESSFRQRLENNPDVKINGRYDKIMEFGDEQQYYTVIDIKSGGERFDQAKLYFGLSIQLPFYAYFAKHDPNLKDKQLAGLFISPVLSMDLIGDGKKTYREIVDSSFKLDGVFVCEKDPLLALDPYYGGSTYIKGCKTNKEGNFSEKSQAEFGRVKNREQLDKLASRAEEVVLDVDKNIMEGNFAISPIKIGNEAEACEHCELKAICYRNIKDIRRVVKPKGLDDEEDGHGVDE